MHRVPRAAAPYARGGCGADLASVPKRLPPAPHSNGAYSPLAQSGMPHAQSDNAPSPHPSFLTLSTQSARRSQPADATKSSARSAASAEQAVCACTSRPSAGEKDAQQAPASSGGEQSVFTLRRSSHSDTLARARTQAIAVSTTGCQAASTSRSQQGEGGRQRTAKLVRGHQHHHLLRPALASHLYLRGGSVPMLPGQRLAHPSPSRSGVQIF